MDDGAEEHAFDCALFERDAGVSRFRRVASAFALFPLLRAVCICAFGQSRDRYAARGDVDYLLVEAGEVGVASRCLATGSVFFYSVLPAV